jgi:hypothetical protein
VAVANGDLYVTNNNIGTIGEYDATTGAVINTALVTGLSSPYSLAVAAVPEPAAWPLLAAMVGVGVAVIRKRRG